MSNETLFYVFGLSLMSVALIVSFVGIKAKGFPSRGALAAVLGLFAVLVLGTTVFAVRYSRDEQITRRNEKSEAADAAANADLAPGANTGPSATPPADTGATGDQGGGAQAGLGPGGTLSLTADTTALAYEQKTLTSKPGAVTIDFENPAPIPHNVAIRKGSDQIAASDTVAQDKTSVTAELKPGTYTFYCAIPGHEEAGMRGTLTVN